MSVAAKVREALQRGEIPAEFMEEHRLLSPTHAAAREFSTTMNRIHDRLMKGLLGANYPKNETAVQFMLSADKEPNAFIVTGAKPPVIAITTGMINQCENESELAAVLCHELGHDYFKKMLGLHDNGKLEELGADLRSPYMLRMANYPQDAMRKVIEKFPDDTLPEFLATAADPHPLKKTRVSSLQTAERALVRGKYGMGEQTNVIDTAVSSSLKRAASGASFTSYVDALLAKRGYNAATTEGKMGILRDVIKDELSHGDPYFKSRIRDVSERLMSLSINTGNGAQKTALNDLVNTIIHDSNGAGETFYASLQHACNVQSKKLLYGQELLPIGGLADVENAIQRFTRATQPAEIKAAAKSLNELAQRYPFGKSGSLVDKVTFSGFAFPDKKVIEAASPTNPITLAWDKHVRLAVESKDADVLQALGRLGVEKDPRLTSLLSTMPGKVSTFNGAAPETTTYRSAGEGKKSSPHKVMFNEHGQVVGYKNVGHDALYAEEMAAKTEQLAQRAIAEKELVKSTDWRELERNFAGFVDKNSKHLIPDMTIVGGEYPFAEEFVRQCQSLIGKNPVKYRPIVNAFFSKQQIPDINGYLENMTLEYILHYRPTRSRINPELSVHDRGNGMPTDHPFAKFVLDDPEKLFDAKDKLSLLQHTRYYDMNPALVTSAEGRWLADNSKIFEGLPCKNVSELEAWLGKLREAFPKEAIPTKQFISDLIQFEALRTIGKATKPLTLQEVRLMREIASFNPDAEEKIAAALRGHIERTSTEFARTTKPASDVNALLEEFKVLGAERVGTNYYPPIFTEHPQLRAQYQEAIKAALDRVTDPAEKAKYLEALLFRDKLTSAHSEMLNGIAPDSKRYWQKGVSHFQYDGALVDPEFKEWATKKYATTIASTLGADTETPEYAAKFAAAIDRIREEAPAGNAISILNTLGSKACGNQLLLQEETSGYIKSTLEKIGVGQVVKYNFHAAIGETALESLGKNYSTRKSTIDFLTSPFSRENAAKLIHDAEQVLSEKDRDKFLSHNLSEEAKIEQMELLHKNFWSLPFEGRILATKQILFDASHHADEATAVEENVKLVLDKVMPLNGGAAKAEVTSGRNVITSYLEATTNLEDKRLITSAMLVANQPNGATAGEKLSVGKGLNLVLSSIDPAGDKVKQAIESHPDTPANIKAEFKDAKTMAKDPQRHDILQWVKETNAEVAEADRIKCGKVLGAGSYGITVEGIKADGTKIARTILYPHVREKAANEFNILTDATGRLVQKDKMFAPVTDMVRQAQRMSHIETDMDIAAKQAKVASQLYDGTKVIVDGKTYTFSAAKYLGHGVNHKDFEIIDGLHFNDLAQAATTAEEKAHVKGLAKAQITTELFNLLSGRPFDHDRHGGQQKIVGTHIGQFDFGAMTVTEMSQREKQLIGHVLGGTIKQHYVKGVPIAEALRAEIKRCPATEAEKDFLAAVERGVLALGNFQSHMQGDELGSVIGAVFNSGKVDPVIKQGMQDRLGAISGRVFSELEKKGKASGINIEVLEQTFEASKDTSPLRPPPQETLLERIPLKNEHIQAGAGATVGFAGFGMLLHANHRIAEKKKKGEEITGWDRAEQVGGGVLGSTGTLATIDGAAFKGNGLKNITKLKFGTASAVTLGVAAVGGTALYLLSKKKNQNPEKEITSWTEKARRDDTPQQQMTI